MTLDEAKKLKVYTQVYCRDYVNADGSPTVVRVSGAPKTWKRSPERVQVPVKVGYRHHDYITEWNLDRYELSDFTEDDNETD